MKKFFRLVSMLAVAGLTFAYTSCTDYSEDVNRLDKRIDGHVNDVNGQIEGLKKTDTELQSLIDAANADIKALQDNTASLKDELTKLSEKHDADIKALAATHAADKAAIEEQLAAKADELETALETLDAKYAQKFSDLEAAYKQADVELKSQITQNSTRIATLESDVKKINDEVIPAVKKQIEDLAAKADETYATKVELAAKTTEVIELVTTEVADLKASIKGVSDRLTTLEAAHETLKESFEETKTAHSTAISDLQTKLAALEASHKTDIDAVKDLVKAAQEAANAAQVAADDAKTAAENAQKTANEAVTAAANAQKAAEAAQETATEALGKVDALIEALDVYAQKGVLVNKIKELVQADIDLAAKDAELVAADAELANKYKELAEQDEKFQEMIDGIKADLAKMGKDLSKEDSILAANIEAAKNEAAANLAAAQEAINQRFALLQETLKNEIKGVYNYIEVEDAELQAQIDSLAEVKFNKADFAGEFKKAYELRFKNDFKSAWDTTFPNAFKTAFETAWGDTFPNAFKTAFETAWGNTFQGAFDTAIQAAILDDGFVGQMVNDKVNDAKSVLEEKIQKAKENLQGQINKINTKVGDILLVVGKLADRIQSITFVPEYDSYYGGQFAATLYYYWTIIQVDGVPVDVLISDTKTVVAKFEVYPKSQAEKVADMLKSGEGASLVAVPLKAAGTRGAAEAPKAKIKKAVADENGVVDIEAVFGAEVNYYEDDLDPKKDAVSFAIALRVESPAETDVRDGVGSETKDAGKYIESAYVPVEISKNSKVEGFCLYDFEKEVKFNDKEDAYVKYEWSNPENQWNYFAGYDYAVMMYDRTGKKCFKTLAEAAEMMNIDVKVITPKFTVKPEVRKLGGSSPVVTPANAKYFTPKANTKGLIDFATLADCNIAMDTDIVKDDPKSAVGNVMEHCVDFKIENIGTVCHYDVYYEIIRRQVTFNVEPFEGKNRIDWSYAKAVALSTGKTFAEAYNKPIIFEECSVERKDDNNDHKVNLGDILKLTPTYEVTVNGEKQTLPATTTPIEIDKVAHLVAEVAEVRIPGGAYKFAVADKNIEVKSVYRVDDNATDYNVIFNYVLGAMPGKQVVDLPAREINFTTGKIEFVAEYTLDDCRKLLVENIGKYFESADQLWASVIEKEVKPSRLYWRNKIVLLPDASSAHSINILAGGVKVKVAREYLEKFTDTFDFTAVNETWYGVEYTFKIADDGIACVPPSYVLAPAPDRLNVDWTGTINPQETSTSYILQQDIDLSKYVIVKDSKNAGKPITETALTIDYFNLTKEDEAEGILRIPAIAKPSVKVLPSTTTPQFPTIEESMINWLTKTRETSFTARELEILAILKLEGIELNRQIIKLSTPCPITKFAFDNFVEKVTTKNVTVKLWNQMVIEGVRQPGVNLINQSAANLKASYGYYPFTEANAYDCVVTFPDKKDVEVYVGGEKQNMYNQEKFEYDPVNGTITFVGDLNDLVKPVEFKFKATLNYVLDYNHKRPLKTDVSVTFQK